MAAHVRESGSTSHLLKFSEYRVTGYGVAFATEIALAKDEIRLAEMECDLLVERTQAGLSRAKAEGKKLGRPSKIAPEARDAIVEKKNSGTSVSALAREYGVSRATIAAILD